MPARPIAWQKRSARSARSEWRRSGPSRRTLAWAGLLASAALVSAACSGNHHPVAAPPATGEQVTRGTASWYGTKFDGRRTASGERYDMRKLTAAHPSLPFGTLVQVTNLDNGRQVVVRINDRGPFGRRRVIDLSYAAARELAIVGPGTAQVELAVIGRYDPAAPPAPPAQPMLLASATAPARPAAGASADPAVASADIALPDAPAHVAPAYGSPAHAASGHGAAAPGGAAAAGAAEAAGAVETTDTAETMDSADIPHTAELVHRARPAGTAEAARRTGQFHFTVQVGAFGEVERAQALQQDLAGRYPETAVLSDGTWNRVQVGHFDDREQAETLRRELASIGLAAIVVAAR